MAKDLKSILAGVKSSKIAPPAIDDKNLYQWNAKDGVAFIKKHKIETHDDRAGNGDDVYKGKTKKTNKYKFQSDSVYEETELDEISQSKLSDYVTAASERLASGADADNRQKEANRISGVYTAIKKIRPEAPIPGNVKVPANEETEIDEKYMGFHALKGQLTQTGAKSPSALAAWIGRRKYGKEKFQAAAAKDKKLGEGSCNHTMEGVICEVHGKSACPTKENDVNLQKKGKKDEKGREYLADKKKCMEEVQYIEEVLTAKDPVSKWIHHFVHSKNPKFEGKSIKQRQQMALGAYYDKKRGRSLDKESGSATNTDYTGPGAAGWTTGRHDMGTL